MLVYIEGKVLEDPNVKTLRNYDCIRNKVSTFDEGMSLNYWVGSVNRSYFYEVHVTKHKQQHVDE